MSQATGKQPISRDDLERSFKEVLGQSEDTVKDFLPPVVVGTGVALGFGAVVIFLLGRRRGRRRASVVEVRRI
ncbi:MAG: hypothetical protein WCK25_03580 [Actinomycetes bacterium]